MLNLRKVAQDDARLLFKWINEPEARVNTTNPKRISWDEHLAWLECKLSDNSTYIYVLADLQENIGVIRFEESNGRFIISYSIDKNYRGKGFGMLILKRGMDELCKTVKNPVFIGYVKKENIASKKIFDRLNFVVAKEEIINGSEFIIYQKSNE